MNRRLTWRAVVAPALSATLLVVILFAPARLAAGERMAVARLVDPLVDVRALVLVTFERVPGWDRVRRFILARDNGDSEPLRDLVMWAIGLRGEPVEARLAAINSRVNADFTYASDIDTWGRDDYWATPLENVEKGRMDCEDFASLKLYLADIAGIDPTDMALLAGRIRSSGEAHVVLWARVDGRGYVLDNRLPYVVGSGGYTDFTVAYSVDLQRMRIYRATPTLKTAGKTAGALVAPARDAKAEAELLEIAYER